MTAIDIATFKSEFRNWLASGRLLNTLPYVEGGWESWIQIDFTAYLNNRLLHDYDIRREVLGVFVSAQQRADWLMNSMTLGTTPLIFELKAQSYKSTNFLGLVAEDIAKLGSSNIAPAFRGSQRFAFAATIDQRTFDALTNGGFTLLGFDGANVAAFMVREVTA